MSSDDVPWAKGATIRLLKGKGYSKGMKESDERKDEVSEAECPQE